jgi:Tol biopolymer transport system component
MKTISFILFTLLFFSSSFAQKKIVYSSNQNSTGKLQIFIMNEDGSGKTQLTSLPYNTVNPKFSPDGKQIVFSSKPGHIYLIRNIDDIASNPPYYLWRGYYPVFSPDGNQVIFNNEYERILSIMIIDTNGAEAGLITDGSYSNMYRLSPDGNKLVFSSMYEGSKTVLVADITDTTDNYISRVSINSNANIEPDISVDGKYVYASFNNNLNGTIVLYDNGKEIPLTKDLISTNTPRFSPDGKKIAFVAIAGESVKLYTMNSDGSGKKQHPVSGGNVNVFKWIDNERILFDATTMSSGNIGIVNISTGNIQALTGSGMNMHPDIQ